MDKLISLYSHRNFVFEIRCDASHWNLTDVLHSEDLIYMYFQTGENMKEKMLI